MRRRWRSRFSLIASIAVVAVAVGAAVIGGLAGDQERIGSLWVGGTLRADGLEVTEVIDYDFGYQQRHGIYRDIPDLLPGADIVVASPTAPADARVTDSVFDTNVRIGSPSTTVSQRHRYRIDFTLDRQAVVVGGLFSWNVVGDAWTVGIEEVTATVALDRAPSEIRCEYGDPWDARTCTVTEPEPGLLTATVEDLGAGQGITISARLTGEPVAPALPAPPSGPAEDPGTGLLPIALVALGAGLVGSLVSLVLTRRAGREQVWEGGAADAAHGDVDDAMPVTRMSERELRELTTIEFEPPRGMSSVEGGLVLDERVRDHHLTAWLLESAIREEIDIDDGDDPVLHRGSAPAPATVGPVLDTMFGGRSEVMLGSYDEQFTSGWKMLRGTLDDWLSGADHWDRAGHRRRTIVRIASVVLGLVGLGLALWGGAMAITDGSGRLWVVGLGAAVAGAAGAALANSWELLVRTPRGSSLWLLIQSFRRFLHDSEARHVLEAAERGVLRQYTAWAVALDEADALSLIHI